MVSTTAATTTSISTIVITTRAITTRALAVATTNLPRRRSLESICAKSTENLFETTASQKRKRHLVAMNNLEAQNSRDQELHELEIAHKNELYAI